MCDEVRSTTVTMKMGEEQFLKNKQLVENLRDELRRKNTVKDATWELDTGQVT